MDIVQGYFDKYVECVEPYKNIWKIRWNKFEDIDDMGNTITKWYEVEVKYTPTLDKIKTIIEDYYNTLAQEKILSGFTWENKTVWLSQENQLNYKSLYDLQNETNTVRIGDNNYLTFSTFEDYKKFYLAVINFIKTTLEECWQEKDKFDYTLYKMD